MLARDSRNLKILKKVLRAKRKLKEDIEHIHWEHDEFLPEIEKFHSQARLPEPPETSIVDVQWDDSDKDKAE